MADGPTISVVIPTTNRPTLRQAVDSALGQTHRPAEVIVVFDLDQVPENVDLPSQGVRIMTTGGGRGANAARQRGVEASTGNAIALLDDDDYWFPHKLERQAELLRAAWRDGCRAVVSSGVQLIDYHGLPLDIVPRRLIGERQPVSDYLFKRREFRWGEATMGSSSLLIDRRLLDAVPFDERLPLHEDWDWLLRASREHHVRFVMAAGPQLAYRHQPSGMSLSRSSNWRRSVEWADAQMDIFTAREYGDFLLGVSVSLAVDAGARWEAVRISARALARGRPGPVAMLVAAGLLVLPRAAPRSLLSLRARYRRLTGATA